MKKITLLILGIVIFLGGNIPAQEIQAGKGTLLFSGKIASGVFVEFDDVPQKSETGAYINQNYYGSDGKVYLWNDTEGLAPGNGLRAELTATYTMENIGFRIRLRADNDLDGFDDTVVGRYAYGWINLLNNAFKFTGGFIDLSDNVWGTLGDGDWDIGGNGIRAEFKPFSLKPLERFNLGELNIGAFLLIPVKPNPNRIHDSDKVEIPGNVTFARTLGETAFGFRWTHPWFYTGAQLQLDTDVDGKEIMDATGTSIWSGAGDEMRLMFGLGMTVLPELVLTAEGNFEGLGNWEARGTGDLRQTIQYSFSRLPVPVVNRFIVGLKAKELLWGYDIKELCGWDISPEPWIQFKPFINFKATENFTAGMEFGYGFGYLVNDHPSSSQKFVYEDSNFFIKPNLTYHLKNGIEIKVWYMFNVIAYGNLGKISMFADRKNSDLPREADGLTVVDSIKKHQIALEFVWSF
jgi:hypothetical protein